MAKAPAKKAPTKEEPVSKVSTPVSSERKEIEVLDAEYGKGKGFLYKHADDSIGTTYIYEEAGASKCRIDGIWYVCVYYRNTKTKLLTCTTAERWRSRFTRVKS